MGIKDRLARLEKCVPAERPSIPTVLLRGEAEPRTKGPVIWVETEEGRRLTQRILSGERTA